LERIMGAVFVFMAGGFLIVNVERGKDVTVRVEKNKLFRKFSIVDFLAMNETIAFQNSAEQKHEGRKGLLNSLSFASPGKSCVIC
jgi:hypothetical protein